ncbi:MAG: ATP synthase subunit I [Desulfuromonadales bacterium]|nr:ATP synthase subunit I [Desulfuromonadales bacterium]
MMPPDFWQPVWGFAAGMGTGALYFGGLWLTVSQVGHARRPYRLLAVSFVLRLAAVLAVFYILLPQGWVVLGTAMVGLLVARQLWLRAKGGGKGEKWTSVPTQPSSGSGE